MRPEIMKVAPEFKEWVREIKKTIEDTTKHSISDAKVTKIITDMSKPKRASS